MYLTYAVTFVKSYWIIIIISIFSFPTFQSHVESTTDSNLNSLGGHQYTYQLAYSEIKDYTLPLAHRSHEEAFHHNRTGLWKVLEAECKVLKRRIRRKETANNNAVPIPCEISHVDTFKQFLDGLRRINGEDDDSITFESWNSHCIEQLRNEIRTPLVCQAAAYLAVPFPLKVSDRKSIVTERSPDIINKKVPKRDSLKFISISIDSNYGSAHTTNTITVNSACVHNVTIDILGVGDKLFKKLGWEAAANKLNYIVNFLRNIVDAENTIILYVDGHDIIFQDNTEELINKFLSTNTRILFGAEHACFPLKFFPWDMNIGPWLGYCTRHGNKCSNSRFICDTLYPKSGDQLKNPYNRWLNSGAFIGFASDLRDIAIEVGKMPSDMLSTWPGTDQGLWNHLFLTGMWGISLDYESKIFLSACSVRDDKNDIIPQASDQLVQGNDVILPLIEVPSKDLIIWKNAYADSIPSIIHFNGNGKKMLPELKNRYRTLPGQSETVCRNMMRTHKSFSIE